MDDERDMRRGVSRRKTASNLTFCVKKENDGKYRKVYAALQKKEDDLTEEEHQLILNNTELVKKARESLKKREEVKARSEEVEDPDDILLPKCIELAAALRQSHHLVVYTGAGISTAAEIPDYRGSNGIWTLLQKGKDIGKHDLSRAEPTLTHMALFELYSRGILKYVVSQNCDGLHLRSGLPRSALSEVHGNMHLEVCQTCRPSTQYWRMFDVTENTGRFSHRTMRRCHICNSALIDTIVHFGERGNLPWPLNWPAACKAADSADMILCIGSSLKVLKKYPWLWGMDKPAKKRPKLYIINLQWTPKDDQAVLKINGRCDKVMQEVMRCLQLNIPEYCRLKDPIFCHATHLYPEEIHTTSQPELDSPFKKGETEHYIEVSSLKHGLKRVSSESLSDCPEKVRKVNVFSVVKEEAMDLVNSVENCSSSVAIQSSLTEGKPNFLSKDEIISVEDNSAVKMSTVGVYGRGFAILNDLEMKQEPLEGDQLFINAQSTWFGCEPFTILASAEEVVGQVNLNSDSKNFNDLLIDTKESEVFAISLLGEKREDDVVNSVLSVGHSLMSNSISESLICSKVNIQNLNVDSCCIDGKENVAVPFSRVSPSENPKVFKKVDCEKTTEFNNEAEKVLSSKPQPIIKLQSPSHGLAVKAEGSVDSLGILKGQKMNARSYADILDEEVGVLKMLQLEHNYSKSFEYQDENYVDTKEPNSNFLKDGKETKKESMAEVKDVKDNVRKRSKNSAKDFQEMDDEEKESNTHQSLRASRRVQEKRVLKRETKLGNQSSEDLGNEVKESTGDPVKSNKVTTPLKNKKLTKADFEMRTELKGKTCTFCLKYYTSDSCLFYPSLDFRPRGLEGCICECCDYSSDSEEAEEESSTGDANEGRGDSTDNADEGTSKSSVINPGWYGKGYRKRFRKRK